MGNLNNKKKYTNNRYPSQYSLSDLIGGSCIGSTTLTNVYNEEIKPWPRFMPRSWSEGTLQQSLDASKTAWPIAQSEAIFLPEFPLKETPLRTDYIFLDIISRGAYGRVYKVIKQDTKQAYALKVISKAKIVEENAVAQAKQEVAIQRVVGHHPFILNSLNRWQGRKTLYILTEYIGSGELFSLLEENGILTEDVVKIYVAEIALAIDFLHNAGIVHRDLKASNVLLDNDGHAVIIDFGLAKWLHYTERTNTFCGTPEYMAPEILKGEYYGQEVDWWALGVLMCLLLTNQYPSTTRCDILEHQSELTYTSPAGTLPKEAEELSSAAKDLLKRLLQPEPRLRLKSLLGLSRVAFYMGQDLQSYMLKKASPFRLLGRRPQADKLSDLTNEFSSFDLPPNSTNGTGYSTYV
ncbi:serine/threonine-protein kinase S6KL [Prorops nasuta]|uniref:serine/threonine-protein kinase S6KL n=1 Tax=Prorops nasuta TaxID=863751 RepID=UPI0034CF8180